MLPMATIAQPSDDPHRQGLHSRGYLPHIKIAGATYFITFRLADSLPQAVLARIEAELAAVAQPSSLPKEAGSRLEACATQTTALERQRKLEEALDAGAGACHLQQPEIARLVSEALRHFDAVRYTLHAWVVMPNHVHALLTPLGQHALGEILKSWKQFSALRAKRALNLAGGRFWQPEAYDHWVRDAIEHERITRYILQNPVKARLCARPEDWPWSSAAVPPP
jgi:putative transposase